MQQKQTQKDERGKKWAERHGLSQKARGREQEGGGWDLSGGLNKYLQLVVVYGEVYDQTLLFWSIPPIFISHFIGAPRLPWIPTPCCTTQLFSCNQSLRVFERCIQVCVCVYVHLHLACKYTPEMHLFCCQKGHPKYHLFPYCLSVFRLLLTNHHLISRVVGGGWSKQR